MPRLAIFALGFGLGIAAMLWVIGRSMGTPESIAEPCGCVNQSYCGFHAPVGGTDMADPYDIFRYRAVSRAEAVRIYRGSFTVAWRDLGRALDRLHRAIVRTSRDRS